MPKQVIVTTLWTCSLCNLETDEDKITPYKISGAGVNHHYDICATCVASDPLASILAVGMSDRQVGRTAGDADGRVQCQYCGKSFTQQGMGLHMSSAHNVKSAKAALVENRGTSGKHVCETCGFRARAATGLGAHRRAAHKVVGGSKTAVANRRAAKKA